MAKKDKLITLEKNINLPNKGLYKLKDTINIDDYNVLVQKEDGSKVYTVDSSLLSSGGSGETEIGTPVINGDPSHVLYIDLDGNLTSDGQFSRHPVTQQTKIDVDLSLIPDSPLTDITGLRSGSLFDGQIFGTGIVTVDPANTDLFSLIGNSRGVVVNSTYNFTPGELKQVATTGSLNDTDGNVSFTTIVSDELNGFSGLHLIDLNGTRFDNSTAIKLNTPNIVIGQYEGDSNGYSIPTAAGDEGYVLTAHGPGISATWDELNVMGTFPEIPYFAADGALTSDPYFFRQGYEASTRIHCKVYNNTVLYGLDMLGDGKAQVYSNDYVSFNDARLILHQLDSAVLHYTTDAVAFDGINIENRKTTVGSFTAGNETKIVIDDLTQLITVSNVPTYADDSAATTAGLTTGQLYKTTSSGSTFLKIVP